MDLTPQVRTIIDIIDNKGECAPAFDGHGVCSSDRALDDLRKWLKLPENTPPEEIVEEAKTKSGCKTEACLHESPFIEHSELEERFKPKGPWNSLRWLSNRDIERVLESWKGRYTRMFIVPFQMINFYEYGGELAKLDFSKVPEYDQLCCVLNTDKYGGSGKHWICIYIDNAGGTVEYFDSAGGTTPESVTRFLITAVIELSKLTGKKYKDINVTSMQHQKKDSECGVYCLFYIIARMSGVPYRFFEHQRVPDSDMENFRSFLFRH